MCRNKKQEKSLLLSLFPAQETSLILLSLWKLLTSGLQLEIYLNEMKLSSPNPRPRSQIQVQHLKSKVQRKGTGPGADNIILQASASATVPIPFL